MFYDVIDKERNDKCAVKFYNMAPVIMAHMMEDGDDYRNKKKGESLFNKMVKYMIADKITNDLFK